MPTKIDKWICDVCGTAYITEQAAIDCEAIHGMADELEIVETGKYPTSAGFPGEVVLRVRGTKQIAKYRFVFSEKIAEEGR